MSGSSGSLSTRLKCRLCGSDLTHVFADLGMSPLANSYLAEDELLRPEAFYPLRALVCAECFLVQVQEVQSPKAIFSHYAYLSSYSPTWLRHAESYTEMAVKRFGLDSSSKVVEIASNDGYLLQYFARRGIPVLGVEPAANVAAVAKGRGIPTMTEFFGRKTATELAAGGRADLVVGNNVLAHVPDLNDFVAGLKVVLQLAGTVTIEVPHLLRLIEERQFDTIYHEHFSYFSFLTLQRTFVAQGLRVFDVDELPTHGGSLRVYVCHEDDPRPESEAALELAERETGAGLLRLETYLGFASSVFEEKRAILSFLIGLKSEGKTIIGYGAPAKGNTLLNFCGVRTDFVDFTVDMNPNKQNRYLPGTHIPIRAPDAIRETRPDVVLILPWNLRDEIMEQLSFVREWGGRFAARAPAMTLFE